MTDLVVATGRTADFDIVLNILCIIRICIIRICIIQVYKLDTIQRCILEVAIYEMINTTYLAIVSGVRG
jgi:hypothetical protein